MIRERPEQVVGGSGRYRLLITDNHTEYPLPDPETIGKLDCMYEPKMTIVVDQYMLEELTGDDRLVARLIEALPEGVDKGGIGYLWAIDATEAQIKAIFAAFMDSIFARETGGDDDTFDYWPNAIDMAQQIALDLDTINDANNARAELRTRYLAFIKQFGRVMEFSYDQQDIDPEA